VSGLSLGTGIHAHRPQQGSFQVFAGYWIKPVANKMHWPLPFVRPWHCPTPLNQMGLCHGHVMWSFVLRPVLNFISMTSSTSTPHPFFLEQCRPG
jgi:hypothetical protein